MELVQFIQQTDTTAVVDVADKTELGDYVVDHAQRDENGRYHVGKNEYAVLCDLG